MSIGSIAAEVDEGICHLSVELDFGLQLSQRVQCVELYAGLGGSGCVTVLCR